MLDIKPLLVCVFGVFTWANPASADTAGITEGKVVENVIRQYFSDNPHVMLAVASCESTGYVHRESDGGLKRNLGGSSARGVFQILMRVHGPEMKKMGLNPENDGDYMEYVRHLYNTFGLTPWAESRSCWSKKIKT